MTQSAGAATLFFLTLFAFLFAPSMGAPVLLLQKGSPVPDLVTLTLPGPVLCGDTFE
jgi:hypothetical protein